MSINEIITDNIDQIIRHGDFDPTDMVLDLIWEEILLNSGLVNLWDAIDGDVEYMSLVAKFGASGSAKDAGALRKRLQFLTRKSAKWHLDEEEGFAWQCWEAEGQSRAVVVF